MSGPDLVERLELRSLELSRASATDEKDRYMNVVARLSREDGELMREAAAALPALRSSLEQHKIALNVAVDQLSLHEPGDSRAVSDLFVALASVVCDCADEKSWAIIDSARATQDAGKDSE